MAFAVELGEMADVGVSSENNGGITTAESATPPPSVVVKVSCMLRVGRGGTSKSSPPSFFRANTPRRGQWDCCVCPPFFVFLKQI